MRTISGILTDNKRGMRVINDVDNYVNDCYKMTCEYTINYPETSGTGTIHVVLKIQSISQYDYYNGINRPGANMWFAVSLENNNQEFVNDVKMSTNFDTRNGNISTVFEDTYNFNYDAINGTKISFYYEPNSEAFSDGSTPAYLCPVTTNGYRPLPSGRLSHQIVTINPLANGHIKISNVWKNAFVWLKLNSIWKRCIIWKKINGVWKRGN